MASKKVVMYTDGACSGNPGNGGWGAYIEIDDKKIELSGSENNTTNNRMELKAVIYALDYLNEKRDIIIFTDSKYVMQGIQEWIKKWKIKLRLSISSSAYPAIGVNPGFGEGNVGAPSANHRVITLSFSLNKTFMKMTPFFNK